jgi:hypothetical protein
VRITDVAQALFEQIPHVSDPRQVEQLRDVLLTACLDASADINDPEAEEVIAEWLSESLALYTPSNSWASVYYLYGYLKGFRHKTLLGTQLDPDADEWLRRWMDTHFDECVE